MKRCAVLLSSICLLLVLPLALISAEEDTGQDMGLASAPGDGSRGALLLLATPSPTPPSAEAIEVGDTVTGEITSATPIVDYALELEEGETITVTMRCLDDSDNLDPYLIILGPDGEELERNDDAVTIVDDYRYNAQILNFTAPEDGTYTVQATRFMQEEGSSSGRYELSVEEGVAAAPVEPGAAGEPGGRIEVGDIVTGEIGEFYAVDYRIDLQAGETITVTMRRLDDSDNLDPYLIILGPDGEELISNDDAMALIDNYSYNAQIPGFTPSEAGTHTIRATHFQRDEGTTTGSFELSVTAGGPPTPTSLPPGADAAAGQWAGSSPYVSFEVSRSGNITDFEMSIQMPGSSTCTIQLDIVSVSEGNFSLSGTGITITGVFDSETTLVGTYQISMCGNTVFFGAGTQQQPWAAELIEASTAGTPVPREAVEIEAGDTVTGEITLSIAVVDYTLELEEGQIVTVTMRRLDSSDDLDPYLILLGPDGEELARNDDAEDTVDDYSFNAQIVEFTVPETGMYTIQATRFLQEDGSSTGRYELSVTED